jgi:hypothetical protein
MQVFGCSMPSAQAASNLLIGALTCLLPLYLWQEVGIQHQVLFSCESFNQFVICELLMPWTISASPLMASQWPEFGIHMPLQQ